ncbi:hypothetical protein [Noviherbaspirillum aridicola]|uniref:hypothetical protein n=1 Tax=Noviherbaspirillum aridicola TaxID=2849687 RepID=UPI001EE5F0F9|nr:hypothetical protein [Noviherbaspirillum aridicola]
MDVHSVGFFENWGFGDFQFLKSNPNEPEQPIETSQLGLRIPGTHVPGLLTAGTFIKGGDRQFVYTSRKLQTIVIELAGNDWTRLVIGVPDARAEAARINACVARRR